MRINALPILAGLLVFGAFGCSDSVQPGPQSENGPVKATINGQAWASASSAAAVRASAGLYSLTAMSLTGDYSLVFTLYNIGATGTYPLGTLLSLSGGTISVSKPGTGGWSTTLNGAAGQIVVSTLTATRIAGTFSFTGTPLSGTGNLAVTNGTFDVPVSGSVAFAALPDNLGGRFTATVAGASSGVNGVNAVLTTGATPTLLIIAGGERSINISLTNMTGAGTYTLNAAALRTIQVTGSPTSQAATWNSQTAGGSGTVIITSITATRIIGSYTATLAALTGGATGTLAVSGTFDFGRGAVLF